MNHHQLRILRRAAAPLLLATLTACGGGGGDDDSAQAQQINGDLTATTFADTSDRVLDSVLRAFDFGDTVEGVLPASATDEPAARRAGAEVATHGLAHGRLERALVQRLLQRSSGAQAQAVVSTDLPCSGGGQLRVSATYANSGRLSVGDRIDVSAQNCVEDGLPLTGSLTLVIGQFSETTSGTSASIALSAGGFGSSALRLNGAATISLNQTPTVSTLSVAYLGATAQTPLRTHTWDHSYTVSYSELTQTATLSFAGLAYSAAGNRFQLRQDEAFVLDGNDVPQSGRLSFIDKDGDRVEVSADGLGYSYTFYVAGNPSPVAGPIQGPRHPG